MGEPIVEPIGDLLNPCNNTLVRPTDFYSLWHPYILLYSLHCVIAALFAIMSLKVPKTTCGLIAASGVTFLISACANIPIWGHSPDSFLWMGVFIKWLIVDLAATVPVLLMKGVEFSPRVVRMMGIPIYVILGSNVIWTMFLDSEEMFIVYVNRVSGACLTIGLILHCVAVCRAGLGLFEVRGGFPYGFGTSYSWIVCYTVWNFLFAARIGLGTTLQDFLFWAIMLFYQWYDDKQLPVELYFGFARPVQLGSYIGFTEFIGAFVPYFYEAPTLAEEQPLPIYSNSFILFVAWLNMLLGICVVVWAAQRAINGLGFFQERFEKVHKLQAGLIVDQEDQEMEALVDEEDYEDEEDDEEKSGCVVA